MKKVYWLIWVTILLFTFESCTKDQPAPNDSKKAAVKQQSSSDQPQTQPDPQTPPSSCPHAAGSTQRG
jgi:PBP1b-binding outer membrane lipoprotein LpoB